MQEFAAAIWERRRRIPSTTYNDPLDHIFAEFDEDSDGSLSAAEVARALQSRGVDATEDVMQTFINGAYVWCAWEQAWLCAKCRHAPK